MRIGRQKEAIMDRKVITGIRGFFLMAAFLLALCSRSGCQELPVYQMYLIQPSLVNPAVIGSSGCTEIGLLDRHQWIGAFKGAPKTQILAAETSLPSGEDRDHGLGLQLTNDANGAYRQMAARLGYAFQFALDRTGEFRLGLGLMAGVYQSTYDERDFTMISDPIVTWSVEREIRPDASAGIFLYGDQFCLGLSAVQLFAMPSDLNPSGDSRGYFIHGTYDLPVRGDLGIQPGLVVKHLSGQLQSDLNARVTSGGSWWAMISYRHLWQGLPGSPGSLILYAGLEYGNLNFGYGYELGLNSILRHGFGSHEFRVGYRVCRSRMRCPAYPGIR